MPRAVRNVDDDTLELEDVERPTTPIQQAAICAERSVETGTDVACFPLEKVCGAVAELCQSFCVNIIAPPCRKAEKKFDKAVYKRKKKKKKEFEKQKFKLVNIPSGWRPKINQIHGSKVPVIQVKPADDTLRGGQVKRLSPALKKQGLSDRAKLPNNYRIPYDPRNRYMEPPEKFPVDRPRKIAQPLPEPDWEDPPQPSGAPLPRFNDNFEYLKKEPHFVPYDAPPPEAWRIRRPETPQSSVSSTWSEDGIDDQSPRKPKEKPQPPIPPKIPKGKPSNRSKSVHREIVTVKWPDPVPVKKKEFFTGGVQDAKGVHAKFLVEHQRLIRPTPLQKTLEAKSKSLSPKYRKLGIPVSAKTPHGRQSTPEYYDHLDRPKEEDLDWHAKPLRAKTAPNQYALKSKAKEKEDEMRRQVYHTQFKSLNKALKLEKQGRFHMAAKGISWF